jgi:hypothetical protein
MDKQVADIMWTVRLMRMEGDALSPYQVFLKQQYIFFYDRATVEATLLEIERIGFQWNVRRPGVPDMCILVS